MPAGTYQADRPPINNSLLIGLRSLGANTADKLFHIWQDFKQHYQ